MASRPLKIAFTSLTLSLMVTLSLWVIFASYEQIQISRAVTLQMPSSPAEINSHEVRDNLQPKPSSIDPFSELDNQPQVVELENLPKLDGIEAAPVSQNSAGGDGPLPLPTVDEVEILPLLPADPAPGNPSTDDTPLDLPELKLSDPDDDETLELPLIAPNADDPARLEQTAPPLVELLPEPLTAPRPPAWLSAQSTLEAEIEELRKKQKTLEGALVNQQQQLEDRRKLEDFWAEQRQAWTKEKQELTEKLVAAQKQTGETEKELAALRKRAEDLGEQLEAAGQDARRSRQQAEQLDNLLKESQSRNSNLKDTLREKLSTISTLENDARKARHQIEELRQKRAANPSVSFPSAQYPEGSSGADTGPPDNRAPALLPPLPDQSLNSVQNEALRAEPIIPHVAGPPELSATPDFRSGYESVPSRTPLIPAVVTAADVCQCRACTARLRDEPKKRGLIYELKDWYHDWRHADESCATCEPLCEQSGQCLQYRPEAPEEIGLIPEIARWWDDRVDSWK